MPQARSRREIVSVSIAVAFVFFMENFDAIAILAVLPEIAKTFNVDAIAASASVTAYLVALAVVIPISGWLADRFGTTRVFCGAIAVFAIAAALSAGARNLTEFVFARGIQGSAAAMMVPVGRLIMLRAIDKAHFVRAMSVVTTPALLGGVIAPAVAGFLATYYSWRWTFLIQAPVAAVGVVFAARSLKKYSVVDRYPFDLCGFLLLGATLVMLILVLNGLAGTAPLAPHQWIMIAVLPFAAAAVVAHNLGKPGALLDFSLFRIKTFASAAGPGTLSGIASAAVPFLIPLLLQVGLGWSSFHAGLLLMVWAFGAVAMKASAPGILRRFGFRTVLVLNALLLAVSSAFCAVFDEHTPWWAIAAVLLLFGSVRSLQLTVLNTLTYADVTPSDASAATSFASLLRQLANSLGVAGGAVILQMFVDIGGLGLSAAPIRGALVVVSVLPLISAVMFSMLPPDAGSSISRHQPRCR